MKPNLFTIKTLTNLHVGSGDTNYGIIDNLVQRDTLTKFPTIHESSLKGAIKEFFTNEVKIEMTLNSSSDALKDARIKDIFGNESGSGVFRFFSGNLLLFPVRTDKKPYLMATCPQILKELLELSQTFGLEIPNKESIKYLSTLPVEDSTPFVFSDEIKDRCIEFETIRTLRTTPPPNAFPSILGEPSDFVLLSNEDMKKVCGENNLPVIARNSLTDGESTNLWYEEIVPRQSLFYCFIIDAKTKELEQATQDFFDEKMKKPMQIGANASIGYGLVKFEAQKA